MPADEVEQNVCGGSDGADGQRRQESQRGGRRSGILMQAVAIQATKNCRDYDSEDCRAGERVQNRAMEPEESAGAGDIAEVIEIGGDAGDDEHGRAVARQVPLSGSREQQRRQRMSDGFHCRVLFGL